MCLCITQRYPLVLTTARGRQRAEQNELALASGHSLHEKARNWDQYAVLPYTTDWPSLGCHDSTASST